MRGQRSSHGAHLSLCPSSDLRFIMLATPSRGGRSPRRVTTPAVYTLGSFFEAFAFFLTLVPLSLSLPARPEGAREDGGERCHPAVLQMYM